MAEPKPSLVGLDRQSLEGIAVELGEKPFRGRQLAERIYGHAIPSLDEMPELPKRFRSALADGWVVNPLHVADSKRSSDGVQKLLVHRGDEQVYECVLIPYRSRVSCCLSSQVGCPMGCTFCATGLGGFDRNLDAAEIVGQYLLLQGLTERRISHVVFMGMGEPLLNLPNLRRAIALLHDELGISHRRITVSTVGIVPGMMDLADKGPPVNLALSLHAANDETRSKLMPVNDKWSVQETVGAMRAWQAATGRKATFEYLMISGINDSAEDAQALAQLVRGTPHVVNLIPFNYVDTTHSFARPSKDAVRAFRVGLEAQGINVTQRTERGHDIEAACGQLAGAHRGAFARRQRKSGSPPLPSSSS